MTPLLAALVGGLLALDGVSVAQTMVSRPLVTATLVGAVLGDAVTGAAVGALLELYLVVAVPTGGGRFPEGSVAGTVGASAAVAVGGAAGIGAGVALGIVWGWIGGGSQSWLRTRNGVRAVLAVEGPVTPTRIRRSVLGGLTLDFVRATVVCGAGVFAGWVLLPELVIAGAVPTVLLGAVLLGGGMVSAGILLRTSVRGRGDWVAAAVAAAIGWWLTGGGA